MGKNYIGVEDTKFDFLILNVVRGGRGMGGH